MYPESCLARPALSAGLRGALAIVFRRGGRFGRCGKPDLGYPHLAGLVHGVHAAPPACGQLIGREQDAAVRGALHPAERPVGGGGVGHTVVQGVGHPAGKILRQGIAPAPLLKEIAAVLGPCQLTADAGRPGGGDIAGLGPQCNGPPGEVTQEIRQGHGAVHGSVGVGGGVVQQHEIR